MSFDANFCLKRGDMIWGLSKTIEEYASPRYYEHICFYPVSPMREVSFAGRSNAMLLSRGRDGSRGIDVIASLTRKGLNPLGTRDAVGVAHSILKSMRAAGRSANDLDWVYSQHYLVALLTNDRYSILRPLVNDLLEYSASIGDLPVPGWRNDNAMHIAIKRMNKFGLKFHLSRRGVADNLRDPNRPPQEPPSRIHFVLDGIDMERVVRKTDSTACGMSVNAPMDLTHRGYTGSELRYLYRHRHQIGELIYFYRARELVLPPWWENPGLWSTYRPRSA